MFSHQAPFLPPFTAIAFCHAVSCLVDAMQMYRIDNLQLLFADNPTIDQ